MKESNKQKSQHGYNTQKNIENLLDYCITANYIISYQKKYRAGKIGYSNQEQFYAPYIINFSEDEQWIIYSTTSLRTDRIKGTQWDSYNLKEINNRIKKSILTYSDALSKNDQMDFEKQNNKYLNKEEFSAIDNILSHDQLINLIELHATKDLNLGQLKNIQGRQYEKKIAEILSSHDNLIKWRDNDPFQEGVNYPLFMTIMNSFNVSPSAVVNITATADDNLIGKLPSGGNPKTDVLITITLVNNRKKTYTLSCKRSSDKKVSVHQYKASDFIKVLDKNNTTLSYLLNEFQKNPTLESFGEANIIALTAELIKYNKKLTLWALGGIGGAGNKDTQWASHILTYNNITGESSIHSIEGYYQLLKNSNIVGHFGTFFTWTYASKCRGKSIVLKVKIL